MLWYAIHAHSGPGYRRMRLNDSARSEGRRTNSVWEDGLSALTVELILPRDWWCHRNSGCMINDLKLTVTGCRSVRRNIFRRSLTPVFWRASLSVHDPFPDFWGPRGPGTSWGTTLTNSTKGQPPDLGGTPHPITQMWEVWDSCSTTMTW